MYSENFKVLLSMITISKIEVTQGGNAIYELPLKQSIGNFKGIESERNLSIKENLEGIPDFEKKLEYYNKNICSLSKYSMAGSIYFEWGNPDQKIKIYCGCQACRKTTDFSEEQEQIYFKLRNKEVKRIVKAIAAAKTYKDKLQVIFSIKGYFPDVPPALYANIPFDPAKDPDTALYFTEPIIDLKPKTKEQITIYNQFVKLEFDRIYREHSGFSKNYKCFDSEKEIERLTVTLKKSLDPHNLLLYIRSIIFKHFNYPQCLQLKEESIHVKQLNGQLNQMSLGYSLFPKLVLGEEIDLNRIVLDEQELLRYTHVSEIVKYYGYVEGKINERYKNSTEIEIQADKRTLFELAENNTRYERLVESYNERIKIASIFTDKVKFINKEIENIEIEFLKPAPMEAQNLIKFSLGMYSRFAFESLAIGKDKEIEPFLNDAKKQYVHFVRRTNPDFSEFNYADQLEKIGNDTYMMLLRGVAFLLYNKFLINQLTLETLPAEQPEPKEIIQGNFIVQHLDNLRSAFNSEEDFAIAVNSINSFFTSGKVTINKPVFVKNGNIKNLAFAMGEIWRSQQNEIITYEYLLLYKKLFSIFKNQNLDKHNLFGNNLYKYSISKT